MGICFPNNLKAIQNAQYGKVADPEVPRYVDTDSSPEALQAALPPSVDWDVNDPIASRAGLFRLREKRLTELWQSKNLLQAQKADKKEEILRLARLEEERIAKIRLYRHIGLPGGYIEVGDVVGINGFGYQIEKIWWGERIDTTSIYFDEVGDHHHAPIRLSHLIHGEGYGEAYCIVRRWADLKQNTFAKILEKVLLDPPANIHPDAWKRFVTGDHERVKMLEADGVVVGGSPNEEGILARFAEIRKNPPEELLAMHEKLRPRGWWEKK